MLLIKDPEPGIKNVTPSPTPTPKRKRLTKIDVVRDVEASEVSISDEEIIVYIPKQSWDDTVVALIKSENFWNYNKALIVHALAD